MSDADGWSEIAPAWARSWGDVARPVHLRLIEACRVEAGAAVLDVGCGSGEFLALLSQRGARVAGADPADGMLELARRAVPDGDLRRAGWDALPWADASFDVVTAVNALQFADGTHEALVEACRLIRPGGVIAIANWADRALNDLDAIETALAEASGDETPPDGELRRPGGIEGALEEVELELVEAGLVDVPWTVANDDDLVRAVLLVDDVADIGVEDRRLVVGAARPFRRLDGSYELRNAYRYAVGRRPGAGA